MGEAPSVCPFSSHAKPMKLFRFFAALLLVLGCHAAAAAQISPADSATLLSIYQANRQVRTIQCPFQHDLTKRGETSARFGTLYIERLKTEHPNDIEAKIAMRYSNPEGEFYIITATDLYNGISGHDWHFTLRPGKSSLWKQLGNAMAWAVIGDVLQLMENFNTKLTIASDSQTHTVTLDSSKGFNKGVSRIVMKYDRHSGLIQYLELREKFGSTHKYFLGIDEKGRRHSPRINHSVDQSVYVVKD